MRVGESDAAVRNDAALMQRIGSGDADAFQQVMSHFLPRLIRLAFGILGRRDEAEDIAQEALLALWQTAPDWRSEATIAAYLRTVASRKAIDLLRRRKFQTDDIRWESLEDPERDPETKVQSKQDMQRVLEHMEDLPERQRVALVLAHFEDLSHREAAEVMDIDVGTYSSLLARARRSLRLRLQDEDDGGEDHDAG